MNLSGVLAPLPTPFDDDEQVDVRRLRAAILRWLASPLSGFVVLGSNGEAALMDDSECDRVIDEARTLVPPGRLLIAGTGRESTGAAVSATRRAGQLGADAVLVRTPSFFKAQMTPDAFLRHYTSIADASAVPVLLYNFPGLTGVNLQPATVSRLAAHPNIVGIKESGSHIAQISDLVAMTPETFAVFAGSGSTFHAALCAGVSGGILALAALLPESCCRLHDLVRDKQYDAALVLQRRLLPIARLISTGFGVPGLKAALAVRGVDVGRPRSPLAPLDPSAFAVLHDAMHAVQEVIA